MAISFLVKNVFLLEYSILCTAVQNLPQTIPAEGKAHNSQGCTHHYRQTQGIHRSGSFPFCPDDRSTGVSLRRNAFFFYKICIIHRRHASNLPDLFRKQFLVIVQAKSFLKMGVRKELLHGADMVLSRKMEGNRFNRFTFQQT